MSVIFTDRTLGQANRYNRQTDRRWPTDNSCGPAGVGGFTAETNQAQAELLPSAMPSTVTRSRRTRHRCPWSAWPPECPPSQDERPSTEHKVGKQIDARRCGSSSLHRWAPFDCTNIGRMLDATSLDRANCTFVLHNAWLIGRNVRLCNDFAELQPIVYCFFFWYAVKRTFDGLRSMHSL